MKALVCALLLCSLPAHADESLRAQVEDSARRAGLLHRGRALTIRKISRRSRTLDPVVEGRVWTGRRHLVARARFAVLGRGRSLQVVALRRHGRLWQ
jgi:hypothetical protein